MYNWFDSMIMLEMFVLNIWSYPGFVVRWWLTRGQKPNTVKLPGFESRPLENYYFGIARDRGPTRGNTWLVWTTYVWPGYPCIIQKKIGVIAINSDAPMWFWSSLVDAFIVLLLVVKHNTLIILLTFWYVLACHPTYYPPRVFFFVYSVSCITYPLVD